MMQKFEDEIEKKILRDGESNPDLQRDRLKY